MYEVTYTFEGNLRFVFVGGGVFPEDGFYTRDDEELYDLIAGDTEDVIQAIEHNFATGLESVEVRSI